MTTTTRDELLNAEYFRHASPESVYNLLSQPQNDSSLEGYSKLELSAAAERNHPLINLALARFADSEGGVVKRIFLDSDNPAIRCAVLSNEAFFRHSNITLPLPEEVLFGIITGGKQLEVESLLQNQYVSLNFLAKVALGSDLDAFSKEHAVAVRYMSYNKRLKTSAHDIGKMHDGFSAFLHDKPIRALWKLALTAPDNMMWNHALAEVYSEIAVILLDDEKEKTISELNRRFKSMTNADAAENCSTYTKTCIGIVLERLGLGIT